MTKRTVKLKELESAEDLIKRGLSKEAVERYYRDYVNKRNEVARDVESEIPELLEVFRGISSKDDEQNKGATEESTSEPREISGFPKESEYPAVLEEVAGKESQNIVKKLLRVIKRQWGPVNKATQGETPQKPD